ncbi:extracellular solute-binding protein [Paenibacillus filicis]|uniref:Extracellular solute-binding protein n=1 Tax=Paenibacillus gyeongsangnamensis TaxID=3388067 RepID=A0ABT4QIZ9_9BACL|nr:extracellular solute-binding protein [Paenibacillus filicis]MCZ8516849.1 extracellular solute-binding protein [Paenibacillus filicis]
MIRLKGMTWNHARGIQPLVAASAEFARRHPQVTIEWDARSLLDFENYPLEQLADAYDLIMIDHPHIGTAVAEGLLHPLEERLSAEFLEDQERNSVGRSYASYTWEGRQWALAADAAAQVSAYREDLLTARELPVPHTWDDVRRLASELPEGQRIGMPLVPTHAFSSFFTLISQIGNRKCWSDGSDLDEETGEQTLALLQELMPLLHPKSVDCDPISMSDRMARTNEIAYVPLMYGYSNYARDGFAPHAIRYCDIPSDEGGPRGSMIGGVGLAVSARTRHPDWSARFLELAVGGKFQRTSFFQNGGQPGHRSAWLDPEVNRLSGGFFAQTLRTLDLGSMRPRFDGYIEFQKQAGAWIREGIIRQDPGRKELVRRLNAGFRQCVKGGE